MVLSAMGLPAGADVLAAKLSSLKNGDPTSIHREPQPHPLSDHVHELVEDRGEGIAAVYKPLTLVFTSGGDEGVTSRSQAHQHVDLESLRVVVKDEAATALLSNVPAALCCSPNNGATYRSYVARVLHGLAQEVTRPVAERTKFWVHVVFGHSLDEHGHSMLGFTTTLREVHPLVVYTPDRQPEPDDESGVGGDG